MLNKLHRWRRTRSRKKPRWFSRSKKSIRWTIRLVIFFLAVDTFYLIHIWPNWTTFKQGSIKKSNFIKDYQQQRKAHKNLAPLR